MEIVIVTLVALVAVAVVARRVVRTEVVREGFVGLLYHHGRFERTVEPGRYRVFWTRRLERVDGREALVTVPNQELMTRDQVGIKLSVAVRFRVADAPRALHGVQDYASALYLRTQLVARAIVGAVELDEALLKRAELDTRLKAAVVSEARGLGLEVSDAAFKDFMLAGDLKKTFAEVVRQRKEGQAALERARGEAAALRVMSNAARLIEAHPGLLNLRLVQALGPGTTVVLGTQGFTPVPAPPSTQPAPQETREE